MALITFSDFMIAMKFLVGALAWVCVDTPKIKMVTMSFNVLNDGCLVESLFSQFFFTASMWVCARVPSHCSL